MERQPKDNEFQSLQSQFSGVFSLLLRGLKGSLREKYKIFSYPPEVLKMCPISKESSIEFLINALLLGGWGGADFPSLIN